MVPSLIWIIFSILVWIGVNSIFYPCWKIMSAGMNSRIISHVRQPYRTVGKMTI
jgi:hypothetical protein